MNFSTSDQDTAKAVATSRQCILDAIYVFSSGAKEPTTIAQLLQPLGLFMKAELDHLYFLTAAGAFATRIKAGTVRKVGKGRAANYYRVPPDNAVCLPGGDNDDTAEQFKYFLPGLKEQLADFLSLRAVEGYFTIDTIFSDVMPRGCTDAKLEGRIKRYISLWLCRKETRRELKSLGRERPKRYYLP